MIWPAAVTDKLIADLEHNVTIWSYYYSTVSTSILLIGHRGDVHKCNSKVIEGGTVNWCRSL